MFEALTDAQKRRINKTAQKVLKVQGNAPKGDVLEIALVLDCSLPRDYLCTTAKDMLTFLRQLGKPFLNLRLNLIKWRSDEDFIKYVSSYPDMLMGRAADEKDIIEANKHYDALMAQLAKFYARSRIVFLIASGDYPCLDYGFVQETINPFLCKKIIRITPDGELSYPLVIEKPEPVESESESGQTDQ